MTLSNAGIGLLLQVFSVLHWLFNLNSVILPSYTAGQNNIYVCPCSFSLISYCRFGARNEKSADRERWGGSLGKSSYCTARGTGRIENIKEKAECEPERWTTNHDWWLEASVPMWPLSVLCRVNSWLWHCVITSSEKRSYFLLFRDLSNGESNKHC